MDHSQGPANQVSGNQVTAIGQWLREVTGGNSGSSTMSIINSKNSFSLNLPHPVVQVCDPWCRLTSGDSFSTLPYCQPLEVFNTGGKVQQCNLSPQKQPWYEFYASCTWPADWESKFFQIGRLIWTQIIWHITLSVRGYGVGCWGGEWREWMVGSMFSSL